MKNIFTQQTSAGYLASATLAPLALLAALAVGPALSAQDEEAAAEAGEILVRAVPVEVAFSIQDEDVAEVDEEDDGDEGSGKYLGGAMLKTDPDLAALLKKADEYKKDGNYQVASKYWQAVLERSGDTLYSDDGETYYAMTERVESILAELPDEGLRAYRISADASAREVMAQAQGDYDVETLSKIVKTYFISSLGDDAALQLAGIFMDQLDFVASTRLLRKITDQYPGPSVPLNEVWLKLAVAYTYLGDANMAQQAIARAAEFGNESVQVSREIRNLVETSPRLDDRATSSTEWMMRMGGTRRFGVMPELPNDYLARDLMASWQYFFSPAATFTEDNYQGKVLRFDQAWNEDKVRLTVTGAEKGTIKKWRDNHWRPAGHLLISDEGVVFKTGGDITVWDSDPAENPKWRPLWFNKYIEDEASRTLRQLKSNYGRGGRRSNNDPSGIEEILFFADRIHQSNSIYRDVLYNIEGEIYSIGGDPPKVRNSNRGVQYGQMPRRSRVNSLTAYNMKNGKLLWRQPRLKELTGQVKKAGDSEVLDPFDEIGFMSAPVGVGDLLLVPVSQSGSISIYALDCQDGSLVWKSYLCDEPTGGSQPFSPIEMTVQGSSAYISCGTGVLFAIDPLTGAIQYARRYERSGKEDTNLQHMGITGNMVMDGWEVDLVIPVGNILMLFGSDYDVVWAVDRRTAEFIWKTENRPFNSKFEYLIGIYDDKVYLGGKDSIAAISIKAQGRWEWVEEFNDEYSYGRAMLTPKGIYVPIEDSIAHYSLDGN